MVIGLPPMLNQLPSYSPVAAFDNLASLPNGHVSDTTDNAPAPNWSPEVESTSLEIETRKHASSSFWTRYLPHTKRVIVAVNQVTTDTPIIHQHTQHRGPLGLFLFGRGN